jgi:hypothetical protein
MLHFRSLLVLLGPAQSFSEGDAIPAKVVPPGEPFCCVLMALQCSKCDNETGSQSSDEMLELSSSRGMAHG